MSRKSSSSKKPTLDSNFESELSLFNHHKKNLAENILLLQYVTALYRNKIGASEQKVILPEVMEAMEDWKKAFPIFKGKFKPGLPDFLDPPQEGNRKKG